MSYSFDGANDTMTGTFTSTYNAYPCTLAVFLKITVHPLASDNFLSFGNSSSSNNDSHKLQTASVDDRFWATSVDTTGSEAVVDLNVDAVWAGLVGKFTSATRRDIYIQALANTGSDTTSKVLANVMQFIRAGEGFTAAQDLTGKLAEMAIWDVALSDADITSYLGGTSASIIDAANLIGYWPLSASNATQANEGVDAGGDLTVTGAVFDADHPSGLAPIRLIWRV
jgi:hypothetical protein